MTTSTPPSLSKGQEKARASAKHCNYDQNSRISKIVPLHKRGKVEVPDNYISPRARQALNTLREEFDAVSHDNLRSEALRKEIEEIQGRPTGLSPPRITTLPEVAPEFYLERDNIEESAPDFIKRVYDGWLGKGLTRAHLIHLDKPLYNALAKWLAQPGHTLPEALGFPSKKHQNDLQLEALGISEPRVSVHSVPSGDLRERNRLNSAARRRFG